MLKTKVIHDYVNFEDLLNKSSCHFRKPKIGQLGREIIKACENNSAKWLKRYLSNCFRTIMNDINNGKEA